ncbi:MAG: AAA family ATPase, partial [Actinobacteria bacterium]|nr:AAA family ATPase [Actinomycetota bacterium]
MSVPTIGAERTRTLPGVTLADALEPHPHARAVLRGAIPPTGSPSHAYLFHGPPGSGKARAARAFAAELLADGAPDSGSVHARVKRGTHPDLTWIVRSGAAEMLVGDIAEPVVSAVAHRPFEASRRVFVLEDADCLNEEAAAKLLKTLEEPPDYAHLVLLTAHPGDLPDTIRSRCQAVRFDAPTTERLERLLESRGVGPEQARACARLALGDADRALALALGQGPVQRHAAELTARACLTGEVTGRPWDAMLASAKESGVAAGAAVTE